MTKTIRDLAIACRDAAQAVANLSTADKDALLRSMAAALEDDTPAILEANARDMAAAQERGTTGAMPLDCPFRRGRPPCWCASPRS
jgi:glutamate-5-semialdehyde dehydrogenase